MPFRVCILTWIQKLLCQPNAVPDRIIPKGYAVHDVQSSTSGRACSVRTIVCEEIVTRVELWCRGVGKERLLLWSGGSCFSESQYHGGR